MENDTVELASLRGSLAPSRHPTPHVIAQTGKRALAEDAAQEMNRYKRLRGDMQTKPGPDTAAASTEVQSWPPLHSSRHAAHSALEDLSHMIESEHAHGDSGGHTNCPSSNVDAPVEVRDREHGGMSHTHAKHPRHYDRGVEKRDRLMRQLRIAAGPEDLTVALETIQPRHYHTRDTIQAAPTDEAKLEILRLHRTYLVEVSIQHLDQYGCVSSRCDVAYAKPTPPMSPGLSSLDRSCENSPARVVAWACHTSWGVSSSQSPTTDRSRTLVFEEQALIQGPKSLTRIHVRSDLSGLDVLPDSFVAIEGKNREPVVVRQYSFMAFARFYYNRICKAVDGDYDPLPAPPIASVPNAGPTSSENPATQRSDGRLATSGPPIVGPSSAAKLSAEAFLPSQHDAMKKPKIVHELEATLMGQLWAAITPHQNPKIGPKDIFTDDDRLAWTGAVDQHAKNQILWLAQLRSAVCALSALAGKE